MDVSRMAVPSDVANPCPLLQLRNLTESRLDRQWNDMFPDLVFADLAFPVCTRSIEVRSAHQEKPCTCLYQESARSTKSFDSP